MPCVSSLWTDVCAGCERQEDTEQLERELREERERSAAAAASMQSQVAAAQVHEAQAKAEARAVAREVKHLRKQLAAEEMRRQEAERKWEVAQVRRGCLMGSVMMCQMAMVHHLLQSLRRSAY